MSIVWNVGLGDELYCVGSFLCGKCCNLVQSVLVVFLELVHYSYSPLCVWRQCCVEVGRIPVVFVVARFVTVVQWT